MTGKRERLAERRKAVGLSQERLAEIMRVDRSTIVRWERGDTVPQPWHRPRLATALRITIEQLAELLIDHLATGVVVDERLGYVMAHPGNVDLVAVAQLRDEIGRLDKKYDRAPATLLLGAAGQLHGQVVYVRRHARKPTVRRALVAVEVESATLVGQLVWDASQRRDHQTAERYFDQAIIAARQVRDVVGEAYAELRKSYVALYGTNEPQLGLARAQRATDVSSPGSAVIAGLAALHVAEAHAMLGEPQECDDALGVAEGHFGRVGEDDDPAMVLFCPSHHGRLAGSCYLSLGQPERAEAPLLAARTVLQEQKKATAIVLGNLALAGIRQRQIDAATTYLHEAIDVVEQTRGAGGLNVAFTAARELQPWHDEPGVQEVNDRLMALMTAT